MFVLNTINMVKCLNILAQSFRQQSIELNHFNATHMCCPHEYTMFDLSHVLCRGLGTFLDQHTTAALNLWRAFVQSSLYHLSHHFFPQKKPKHKPSQKQKTKQKQRKTHNNRNLRERFNLRCQYNCLSGDLWEFQICIETGVLVPFFSRCSYEIIAPQGCMCPWWSLNASFPFVFEPHDQLCEEADKKGSLPSFPLDSRKGKRKKPTHPYSSKTAELPWKHALLHTAPAARDAPQ